MFSLYWNCFGEVLFQIYGRFGGCSLCCLLNCTALSSEGVYSILFSSKQNFRNANYSLQKGDSLSMKINKVSLWKLCFSSESTNTMQTNAQNKHTSFSCQLKWTHSSTDQCYPEVDQCQINRKWRVQWGNNTNNQLLLLSYANHDSSRVSTEELKKLHGRAAERAESRSDSKL